MKLYCLLGLFLLGCAFCRHIDNEIANALNIDDSEDLWAVDPQSTARFAEKCKEVGGEAAAKKFTLAVNKTTTCLNKEVPRSQSDLKKEFENYLEEEADSICSKKRKSFRGCFVDVIDALKDCSREEEKYAPDFVFDAIDAVLDFICGENGKAVNDVLNANETDECIGHIFEEIFSPNMTYDCTKNFKLLNINEEEIVTKTALCTDLLTAKTCYSGFLLRECPNATDLNNFVIGAFNAISSPCKDVELSNPAKATTEASAS